MTILWGSPSCATPASALEFEVEPIGHTISPKHPWALRSSGLPPGQMVNVHLEGEVHTLGGKVRKISKHLEGRVTAPDRIEVMLDEGAVQACGGRGTFTGTISISLEVEQKHGVSFVARLENVTLDLLPNSDPEESEKPSLSLEELLGVRLEEGEGAFAPPKIAEIRKEPLLRHKLQPGDEIVELNGLRLFDTKEAFISYDQANPISLLIRHANGEVEAFSLPLPSNFSEIQPPDHPLNALAYLIFIWALLFAPGSVFLALGPSQRVRWPSRWELFGIPMAWAFLHPAVHNKVPIELAIGLALLAESAAYWIAREQRNWLVHASVWIACLICQGSSLAVLSWVGVESWSEGQEALRAPLLSHPLACLAFFSLLASSATMAPFRLGSSTRKALVIYIVGLSLIVGIALRLGAGMKGGWVGMAMVMVLSALAFIACMLAGASSSRILWLLLSGGPLSAIVSLWISLGLVEIPEEPVVHCLGWAVLGSCILVLVKGIRESPGEKVPATQRQAASK
ncbi:MAG: hypothetical protein RMJ84_04695 [Sandaracinaceae bacterium]|nr:hypothetical protein [Sandaracinaceae bacterium]